MRLGIFACLLIALAADVAAAALLAAGWGSPPILAALGLAVTATVAAGALASHRPRSAPAEVAEATAPVAEPETRGENPHSPSQFLASTDPVPPPIDGDPLDDAPWLKLVEEGVTLFDELDRHRDDFDPPRQELADHVACRLREILERCGVESIGDVADFDRSQHQPVGARGIRPGARVAEVLSPGFRVGRRVLRRARVRVEDPREPDGIASP